MAKQPRRPSKRTEEIRRFLLTHGYVGSPVLVPAATRKFGVTRQAIHRHLAALVEEGILDARGNTRARTYHLKVLDRIEHETSIAGLDEHDVWREQLYKFFLAVPGKATNIAHTVFTEMLNNAIDHSEGNRVSIVVERTAVDVDLEIADNGVGIFQKIKDALGLDDLRHSILELAKGKFTTDPKRHTGMGVLVTSLACDRFRLGSNGIAVTHLRRGARDYLVDDVSFDEGTTAGMTILLDTPVTMDSVYAQLDTPEHPGFTRTVVPLSVAQMGDENLVSRSQAKRVLSRVDRFMDVIFDFKGVSEIGQGFADEIYRVFRLDNPHVNISTINASPAVTRMVALAEAAYNEATQRAQTVNASQAGLFDDSNKSE